ncbi:galactokinase [Croceivirga thetidis]|uniref:Galactokinase n=1 Tax=Croceivirga thetidis TaxID=2721623 RepID=A0ABX1GSW3_9FLAO|nr:galactokinase [Croceivirga thetidis]NKI33052.1 galactokinase [Croceivirga thetidis]
MLKVSSPGRINLIGEHVDYNDGFVLPAAIDKRIYMTFKENGHENRCTVKSKGFDSTLVIDLENLEKGTEGWHDYVLGVINEIQKIGCSLKGFDCQMESKVPIGSGVSSSAALECGLAFGLNELFDLGLEKWQLIKIGQLAEHNFVGTKCGIMDQFASVMGKKEHSMLLDCQSLEFEYIPTQIDPYVILLLNTNVTHNLATSGYNDRREESETGLALICDQFGVEKSFRNIDKHMVDACREQLGEIRYKRCRYVLEENERVLEAAKALKANDLNKLGALLYASHQGQSKDYEVSCPELDFLVELSKNEPSILGARMMGGGFGGCTLNLIHKDVVNEFVNHASVAYKEEFGIPLSHFQTVPSRGTHITTDFQ